MTDPFIAGRSDAAAAAPAHPHSPPMMPALYAGEPLRQGDATPLPRIGSRCRLRASSSAGACGRGAYGGTQTTDGNAAIGTGTTRPAGSMAAAVGADYRLLAGHGRGLRAGRRRHQFQRRQWAGSGRADLFQAGAFVTSQPRRRLSRPRALAYGWQDVTTDRTVTVAGIDRLQARFNANTFSGRVEGGYRFATPWMGITPYAAGQVTTFHASGLCAKACCPAPTPLRLSYGAKTVTASRSELGLRTDKSLAMQRRDPHAARPRRMGA